MNEKSFIGPPQINAVIMMRNGIPISCIPFEYEQIPLLRSGSHELTKLELEYLLNGKPDEPIKDIE